MVTGASAGIGRETAILLSRLGAKVVLTARDPVRLAETSGLLEGALHRVAPFDLGQIDAIPPWMKVVVAESGPLHGVVHCAGVQSALPLSQVNGSEMDNLLRINVASAVALAKGFRQKTVRSHKGGSLVFVASVMGLVGSPCRSLYSASKSAIVGLTRSLALELVRDGIRVNCVAPAFVKTAMLDQMCALQGSAQTSLMAAAHPLGFGEPRDVACAIVFLIADTARWITGTTLVVDGGYTAQ